MNKSKLKTLVFTGTSISHHDAKNILGEATFHPPVFRGNVEKAVREGYKLIGIIDGVFFSRSAVAHKEIIRAIEAGVTIIGGCSMGALRASELDVHGMIGVGKIYGLYRDGVIEDDDEVAVATNPDTFEPVSSPMVNIRETLKAASHEGIIDEESCRLLIDLAKRTHYGERSYFGITEEASKQMIISGEKASRLLAYCRDKETDLKKQDAILVLEKVKELMSR
ncbi:TfuA-related McrA-glycine thioamidation protein [Methanolobus halotolerans]|uniref:TfuA-related McrA-glycine thioamidation protein n=1 Tax=Methanolobus halotolerans TaxID=2052935 RepID=A0A4E0Q7Q7_9EURY|nr:TfuA-related McrA-glycine thioamidation protein [Methanolobus halotolerans]TGC10916.1 TfuA-related McrA-glycine thioamidation protein [Methanolobus halotolerans]